MEFVQTILLESGASIARSLSELILPAIFFLCLALVVKRKQAIVDMQHAVSQSSLNLKIFIFDLLTIAPIIAILLEVIESIGGQYKLTTLTGDFWSSMPNLLVIFIAVFIGDFVGYWRHRLEHTRFLWPSHAVHHSDTEMTWLTIFRFHPINRLTTSAIDLSIPILLGLPKEAILANFLVRHYYGFLIHADLPWTYGKFSYVFVSPAMHRWHHSIVPLYYKTNFATVFSIFDRVFGTYRVPGPCDSALGVSDKMKTTLSGQLIYAFTPGAYKKRKLKKNTNS